jgi:hypothetical protein
MLTGNNVYHTGDLTTNIAVDDLACETKLNVIAILEFILDIRLDFRLSRLISIFKRQYTRSSSIADVNMNSNAALIQGTDIESIFDSCEPNLDLDHSQGQIFLKVLLNLILDDYQPLVSRALSLLFRHFNQRQETLQHLNQVQLLVSEIDIENYKQIKRDLDQLRLFVEKSELWVYKKGKDGTNNHVHTRVHDDEFDMNVGRRIRELSFVIISLSLSVSVLFYLKKFANLSGLTDIEFDADGPMINDESAFRYTSIFQVSYVQYFDIRSIDNMYHIRCYQSTNVSFY